jgi:ribosomal protein S12 methylthiotransferase
VNTCAFIGPAKEESIDAILDAARTKAAREGRRLVVTGCLAQRYADDLTKSLPEVDAFVGTGDLPRILDAVEGRAADAPVVYRGAQHVLPAHAVAPRLRTGGWWTSYLKVSEGCDHTCSFCIIPKIRGRHESRPIDDVVAEASNLAADGTLELNLIAQDLTAVRAATSPATPPSRSCSARSRSACRRSAGSAPLRVPVVVTDELLEVMATEPAVCRYLDMPLQHASDRMLRAMRRERSGRALRELIAKIRAAVPGSRSGPAFIVGFPGETDDDVRELCDFIEEIEFERVGVFRYSKEENTHAATLPGHLPERVKQARFERVMETQQAVAARLARAQVGRTSTCCSKTRSSRAVRRPHGHAGARDRRDDHVQGRRRRRRNRAGARDRREIYDLRAEIVPAVDRESLTP